MKNRQKKYSSDERYLLYLALTILIGVAIGYIYGGFMVTEESSSFVDQVESENSLAEEIENIPENPGSINDLEFAEVSVDDDPALGQENENAIITIIEFSDYQCPFCKQFFDESFYEIINTYVKSGEIQYVFRDLPLESHPQAIPAAITANCAGEQGKYLEMHDKLFKGQEEWSFNNNADQIFQRYAGELTLNTETFNECYKDEFDKQAQEILNDKNDGNSYSAKSTPTFFINGKKIVGAQPTATFRTIIERELAYKRALEAR